MAEAGSLRLNICCNKGLQSNQVHVQCCWFWRNRVPLSGDHDQHSDSSHEDDVSSIKGSDEYLLPIGGMDNDGSELAYTQMLVSTQKRSCRN